MSAGGVTYLAAFGGGIISFLSPCVLPIVPGYLSLVTGLDVTEIEEGANHHLARIARDTGASASNSLYGDALGPRGSGADTVAGMLAANADSLARGLSCGRLDFGVRP